MRNTQKIWLAVIAVTLSFSSASAIYAAEDASFDATIKTALADCQKLSTSCSDTTKAAPGVLVFPNVVKADLIIGGAGGKGALVENGKITGYYNIGAASAGLQAGIDSSSQIYVFRTADALAKLKDGSDWKISGTADVTLIDNDANTRAITGNVLAYVFDAKGLHAGVALDVFRVWKSDKPRAE